MSFKLKPIANTSGFFSQFSVPSILTSAFQDQFEFTLTWQKQKYVISVESASKATLNSLKQFLCAHFPMLLEMKLLHAGAMMKDDQRLLIDYGIRQGSRVMLLATQSVPVEEPVAVVSPYVRLCSQIDEEVQKCIRACLPALAEWRRTVDVVFTGRVSEPMWAQLEDTFEKLRQFRHAESPAYDEGQKHGAVNPKEADPSEKHAIHLYRYLSETVMRLILSLDNVACEQDATGIARTHRKAAIQVGQSVIERLDQVKKASGMDLSLA